MTEIEQTAPAILGMGGTTPAYQARQTDVAQWMSASFADRPVVGRLLRSLYASSGVETRHSCIDDYLHPPDCSRFAPGRPLDQIATTAERMAIYQREAPALAITAAEQALRHFAKGGATSPTAAACAISHLIVVSCTGFFAPGIDLAIARHLKLRPTLERTTIGFMGCAAAFNGLRTAANIVRGCPSAHVLVVCVELCSLHVQPSAEREHLIAGSLFADGAAACIVGMVGDHPGPVYLLEDFYSQVKPDAETAMVWQIGNHGFALRLSPQVPKHLAAIAPAALQQLCPPSDVQFWAIHPGGPAIVDRLAEVFDLSPEQVAVSRLILRRYGNLSSATILFVLAELCNQLQQRNQTRLGVAMAFGPGLVIEMARLRFLPARNQQN